MPDHTPDRRPRSILIGTDEIVQQVFQLGAGFRSIGHRVTTAVGTRNQLYPGASYDIVFDADPSRGVGRGARGAEHMRRLSRVPQLIRRHDTFIFVFGSSLLPRGIDVPLLSALGRDVIFLFLGSDVRHWEASEQFRKSVELASYPGYRDRSPGAAVRRLRRAELWGTMRYLQPSYAEAAIAPYMHAPLALDLSDYGFHLPKREVPIVVHAPSRRSLKGTAEILQALDRLRNTGAEFELRLIEGLPNDALLAELSNADIVIDEIREAHYGMLALEAMASGCAVLAGNRTDIVPLPPSPPVLHVTPETVEEVTGRAIMDASLRTRLAHKGRRFVETHHERSAVAQGILTDLDRVAVGDFDYRPTFFATQYEPMEVRAGFVERLLTAYVAHGSAVSDDAKMALRQRRLSY